MKRGEFVYTAKTKKELPEDAKPLKLILHIIRKESWEYWNELAVYYGHSDEELFLVRDADYFRIPDPDEMYYFYFYTEDERDEKWYYVKINKGATSVKGFLPLEKAKEYIKRWIEGEIYKIEYITEEGEKLLDFLSFRKLELDGVKFFCEEEVFTKKKEINKDDTHIILFEKATIDKLNNDDAMYYIRPSEVMSVIVVKSKNPTYPINCNVQISYYPGYYDGYFIKIYEVMQKDLPNTTLKQFKNETEVILIPLLPLVGHTEIR